MIANLDIFGEQTVEQVDVGVLESGEVLVLLDGSLAGLEDGEA